MSGRLTLRTQGNSVEIPFLGEPLLMEVLQARGVSFAHPCGGRGVCGKCAVQAWGKLSPPDEAEQKHGVRLSCRMRLMGDCEVVLQTPAGFTWQVCGAQGASSLAMAADIGTTTLELRLFDAQTGAPYAGASMLNPQANTAADVVGRVSAALSGKASQLQKSVLEALSSMTAGLPPVTRAVITGNTVMLTLLTGRSVQAFAAAPFPVECLFGHTEAVLGFPAYLPPAIGAFTGADLTCAVLSSGIMERGETALLCDVGTNGEIALWHGGTLYVASTAVGPAFEGAGISCGMGGVPGAIDKAWTAQNALDFHVIGGGEARGFCGSGLVDAVAVLLRLGWIDEYGAMEDERIAVAPGVVLTRQDIRQVQLAKAAVAAGIETLLGAAGVAVEELQTLFIAGGFGSHLNTRSAAAIGLFPRVLAAKAQVLGNAALEGACLLLQNETLRETAGRIAAAARQVTLSGNPLFADAFIGHMNFPFS